MRVPFIARLPGVIEGGGVCTGFATALDILPTVRPAGERAAAGQSVWTEWISGRMFTGEQANVDRDMFLYFDGWNLQCARWGKWKLHVARNNTPAWSPLPPSGRWICRCSPELYDLEPIPVKLSDCAEDNPEIVVQIKSRIARRLTTFPIEVQSAWKCR